MSDTEPPGEDKMGWLSQLVGGGVAEPVEAVGNVLDKLFTSDDERLDKQALLTKLALEPQLAQAEINKVSAQHRTMFVAGARPFILWVCGFGLANSFLINPWLQWISGEPGPVLPEKIMLELVLAMLGLGALRTVEKMNGVAK